MADWGGAQWVLVTLLLVETVLPPMLRVALIDKIRDATPWRNFWIDWCGRSARWAGFVAILAWGGFF